MTVNRLKADYTIFSMRTFPPLLQVLEAVDELPPETQRKLRL